MTTLQAMAGLFREGPHLVNASPAIVMAYKRWLATNKKKRGG